MVNISEKAAYQPLNAPEPILVKENIAGLPTRVGKGNLTVVSVEDKWRIDDEWWRLEPISRMYYVVVFNNGLHMVVYKDLIGGQWYRQTIGATH